MSKDKLDSIKLIEIFEYLDAKLKDNNLKLELVLYGGALMNLLYDNRPATSDIDCIMNNNNDKILTNILNMTAIVYDLKEDWINEEIKEPLKVLLKQDISIMKNYDNLQISTPSKEQLLAMKVLSARAEPAKDFIDAELIIKDIGITTKQELLNIVKQYIPLKYLGERQLMFIKYIGEDLGYRW